MAALVGCILALTVGAGDHHPDRLQAPADFAFGMPVVTEGAGAAYRVALPISVYEGVARDDLGDIRVFNARGEVVPYALSRPAAQTLARGPGTALPLFALRSDTVAAADAVRVTIDSPNAAVKLQTQGSVAAAGAVRQYILDGRMLGEPVAALQLTWPDDSADFTGRLRVDVSDDFSAWRTLTDAAPIANLHANGRQLVHNRIEFSASKAKYWRLSWIGGSAPFSLTAVVAEPADSRVQARQALLEVAADAHAATAGEYLFDLGARLPIESVNLLLPENNTVVDMELSSRRNPRDPWHTVARRQFYRVDTADGELRNQALDMHTLQIAADSDRYWMARMVAPSGAAPAQTLRLQAVWIPSDVVFLARGPGPFLLAYGSAAAPGAETDLSSVASAVTVLRATLGEPRPLGGEARLVPPAPAFPWKRTLLWTVLGASVCLLAWMAYRLSRDMGGSATE
jgi:hypothetical protein